MADISRKKTLAATFFPQYSSFLDKLNWNARWLETVRKARGVPLFESRDELHSFISKTYFGGGADPVDYLEFGVYQGESLRMWSDLNRNPASRLFGFDSFEGLPEDWQKATPKGTFTTHGEAPEIADSRVQFIIGWFQNSLPGFLSSYEPAHRLLIHNDSDLFSSTLYCLSVLNPLIQPGTIVIFDEFDGVLHEYRALATYASSFMRNYKIVGATKDFLRAAVEIY
jgi:hypothetical protein